MRVWCAPPRERCREAALKLKADEDARSPPTVRTAELAGTSSSQQGDDRAPKASAIEDRKREKGSSRSATARATGGPSAVALGSKPDTAAFPEDEACGLRALPGPSRGDGVLRLKLVTRRFLQALFHACTWF